MSYSSWLDNNNQHCQGRNVTILTVTRLSPTLCTLHRRSATFITLEPATATAVAKSIIDTILNAVVDINKDTKPVAEMDAADI